MKQVIHNFRSGQIEVAEVPCPALKRGHVLIQTRASVISAGTERMLVNFGKASLLGKARQQPDKIRQVLDKIKTDGLVPTLEAVRMKIDQALPLGYCNAGEILEIGPGVEGFAPGERVVSNGCHAEVVQVPKNLCAKIPQAVSDEVAAFTVIGAIGLQGIRLIQPTLGENIVVIGLGLIGLMTVQILKANGCRVLGVDVDSVKCDWAGQFGAEIVDISKGGNPIEAAHAFSRGHGVDGVLITASTATSEPVRQAAKMSRKRGRIVLVGVTGLDLNREDFYEKELTFQVSCSYGPGRYDMNYEEKGHDYPIGFVRWSEQRNMEAILSLMAEGRLNIIPMITHRFPIEQAGRAFELISESSTPYLGIVLTYNHEKKGLSDVKAKTIALEGKTSLVSRKASGKPVVGFIGAGDFAAKVLLPALKQTNVQLKTIASLGGVRSVHLGRKYGFDNVTSDVLSIFSDSSINTIFIATRHDSHAEFVKRALNEGKHVFVEKPLCIHAQQLEEIIHTYHSAAKPEMGELVLMVGFNRRFSPLAVKMKELIDSTKSPKSLIMTVNAGYVPPEHWTLDPKVGGGRIVGEACHFIDLFRFFVGKPVVRAEVVSEGRNAGRRADEGGAIITLCYEDGSVGAIHYLTSGNKSFPKERLEVFCRGRVLQLNNFRSLHGYGWPGFKRMKLLKQDKGHKAEIRAFIKAVQEGYEAPIPFGEVVEVMKITFDMVEGLR